MSDFNDLIHDARQVDLEEMIMTNETPMYLVPGWLTDVQTRVIRMALSSSMKSDQAFIRMVQEVGTPIQPCADVETVGWLDPVRMDMIRAERDSHIRVTLANIETPRRNIPLVRRTDMEAQVARVAAEKDAEIDSIKTLLRNLETANEAICAKRSQATYCCMISDGCESDLLALDDARSAARAALNEGAAG